MADLIDKAERARRLARAIASDLTLYNEAKIVQGIQNDSLFEVMRDEIEEGRALFKSRVTAEVYGMNIYERALVGVMLKSKGDVKSRSWCRASRRRRSPECASSSSPGRRRGSGWI